jgi:hypothetical protein
VLAEFHDWAMPPGRRAPTRFIDLQAADGSSEFIRGEPSAPRLDRFSHADGRSKRTPNIWSLSIALNIKVRDREAAAHYPRIKAARQGPE